MSALARQEGTWAGTFRRFNASGMLVESFPSRVTITLPQGCSGAYRQTNIYSPAGRPTMTIDTTGTLADGSISFDNERVSGWARDDPSDAARRVTNLFLLNLDGSGYMYEQIHVDDAGTRRSRVAQYFDSAGVLVRRTLVDEVRED